jgi:tRNA-specific 2-thiouridylase
LGHTPNPDILCNAFIKFGTFFEYAMSHGFDYVATGHYARADKGKLFAGVDINKDQSYFLYRIDQKILERTLFPVGKYTKTKVRAIAKKLGLPQAEKKDSQGICFLGDISMKEFISHYIPQEKGKVLDSQGQEIGEHQGAMLYTIGERHGFTVYDKHKHSSSWKIVHKDVKTNTLTVAPDNISHNVDTEAEIDITSARDAGVLHEVRLKDPVIRGIDIYELAARKDIKTRIRHRQVLQACRIQIDNTHIRDNVSIKIIFDTPQGGVASGQSAVLYIGDECIGGGVMDVV